MLDHLRSLVEAFLVGRRSRSLQKRNRLLEGTFNQTPGEFVIGLLLHDAILQRRLSFSQCRSNNNIGIVSPILLRVGDQSEGILQGVFDDGTSLVGDK